MPRKRSKKNQQTAHVVVLSEREKIKTCGLREKSERHTDTPSHVINDNTLVLQLVSIVEIYEYKYRHQINDSDDYYASKIKENVGYLHIQFV